MGEHIKTILVLAAMFAVAPLAVGQQDFNPHNPANWTVRSSTSGAGQDVIVGWNTSNQQLVRSDSPRKTPDSTVSVEQVPYAMSEAISCAGNAQFRLIWRGLGPAPATDLVIVSSTATYQGDSGSGDPGLPVRSISGSQEGISIHGSQALMLPITGGEALVSVSGSADAQVDYVPTNPLHQSSEAGSARWSAGIQIAQQALAIDPTPLNTYRRGIAANGQVVRMLNAWESVSNRRVDLAVAVEGEVETLTANGSVAASAVLHGDWVVPVAYTWASATLLLPVLGYPVQPFVTATMAADHAHTESMTKGGPWVGKLLATAREVNARPGGTHLPVQEAELEVNFHTPAELAWTTEEQKVGDILTPVYRPDGQPVYVYLAEPGETRTITITNGRSLTTEPPSFTLGAEGRLPVIKSAKLAAGLSTGGTSKGFTYELSESMTFGPAQTAGEHYQVVARWRWTNDVLWFALFDQEGYLGDLDGRKAKPDTVAFVFHRVRLY